MIDSINIAATGMRAEQQQIDTISNNLSNLNTVSFKKSRVSFEDLMYRGVNNDISRLAQARDGNLIGMGAAVSSIKKDYTEGNLKATENPLDIAINGSGFLEVVTANGERIYTRNGSLKIDQNGMLSTLDGQMLADQIYVPPDATNLRIQKDGSVYASIENEEVEIGQIGVVNFTNMADLDPVGEGYYVETSGSGPALYSEAGLDGSGAILQGYLETSNVDLIEEMLALMVAQRAYEVNSQIVKASDEIMKINNSLRV